MSESIELRSHKAPEWRKNLGKSIANSNGHQQNQKREGFEEDEHKDDQETGRRDCLDTIVKPPKGQSITDSPPKQLQVETERNGSSQLQRSGMRVQELKKEEKKRIQ